MCKCAWQVGHENVLRRQSAEDTASACAFVRPLEACSAGEICQRVSQALAVRLRKWGFSGAAMNATLIVL